MTTSRRSIAIVTPYLSGTARGNTVQALRKAEILKGMGFEVHLVDYSLAPAKDPVGWLESELGRAGSRDLIMAIHGLRTGPMAVQAAARLQLPIIIATGGTDIRPGLEDNETASAI